jgi:hypothetical protein
MIKPNFGMAINFSARSRSRLAQRTQQKTAHKKQKGLQAEAGNPDVLNSGCGDRI